MRMRPTRLSGFDYTGRHQYFLAICTFQRQPHFVCEGLVGDVTSAFMRTAREQQFAIPAYCFMPDHLHVLAEGESQHSNLRIFINTAKQRSAHVARRSIRGRLWQAGYFDRLLRQGDNAAEVARYILQNPVRAGLARSTADYPFCGSMICTKEELIESTMWRPGVP